MPYSSKDTRLEKKRKFFAEMARLRKENPDKCIRCFKPRNNETKFCDRCRKLRTDYLRRLREEPYVTPEGIIRTLHQFRRELSRLRQMVKKMATERRQSYNRGYWSGLAMRRTRLRRQVVELPTMTMQEAATISHRFDLQRDDG